MPVRIFPISNFSVLLRAIVDLIESRPQRFFLAGSAEKFDQAIDLIKNTNIDIVLLDIDSYPDEVVPLIKTLLAVSEAKVLLITRLENLTLQDNAIIAATSYRRSSILQDSIQRKPGMGLVDCRSSVEVEGSSGIAHRKLSVGRSSAWPGSTSLRRGHTLLAF